MPSKWDLLLDKKPVPLLEHLLEECARLFAADLLRWPPVLDEQAPEVTAVIAAAKHAPDAGTWRESFRLARWDLQREHDAYDDYVRHRRWLEAGLAPDAKGLLLFLSRLVYEQLVALGEATQGRVDRKAMLRVLDLTERAVLKDRPDATITARA
jgi:hypothetical protein